MSRLRNIGLALAVLFCTGLVAAEWEVLNAHLDDKQDDVMFMPASPSSQHSKRGPSKKHGAKTSLAQQTYQTTTPIDPFLQFQNVKFSTNPIKQNNDVVKMTSSKNKKSPKDKQKKTVTLHGGKINSNNDKNKVSNNIPKKTETLSQKPIPVKSKEDKFATKNFHSRDLLEQESNSKENNLEKVQEFNNNNKYHEEDKEYAALIVEEEKEVRKMEEEEEEVDCEDEININEYDCLYLHNERQRLTDDANMSQAGDLARKQLLDFMDLNERHKRQAQDDGSGTDPTFPEDEVITDGEYTLTRPIMFLVTVTNSSEEIGVLLTRKLKRVFRRLNGFKGLSVRNVRIANGRVTADWTLSVRGSGIGAFGGNEVDVANELQFQLLNVSKPLYDVIDIGGSNPRDPLNTADIANTLAGNLNDICSSENACSANFESCVVTGYDEGKCLHKCRIFTDNRDCEHGGYCDMGFSSSGNSYAFCQCTSNWKGSHCQTRKNLNAGEITGVTLGAALLAISMVGCCCWWAICRRRRRPVNMTYFGDDSDSSERFSSPSSKISTFVIDRPRIRTAPIRSFSPHSHDDFSRPSTLSSLPPPRRVRQPPNLYSDA